VGKFEFISFSVSSDHKPNDRPRARLSNSNPYIKPKLIPIANPEWDNLFLYEKRSNGLRKSSKDCKVQKGSVNSR